MYASSGRQRRSTGSTWPARDDQRQQHDRPEGAAAQHHHRRVHLLHRDLDQQVRDAPGDAERREEQETASTHVQILAAAADRDLQEVDLRVRPSRASRPATGGHALLDSLRGRTRRRGSPRAHPGRPVPRRERRMARDRGDPRRPGPLGRVPRPRRRRRGGRARDHGARRSRRSPAPRRARSATSTPRSWTRRGSRRSAPPRSRSRSVSSPRPTRSRPCSPCWARSSAVAAAACSGCSSTTTRATRAATSSSSSRAASACPTSATTARTSSRRTARRTARSSRRCSRWPGSTSRRPAPTACSRSRRRSPAPTGTTCATRDVQATYNPTSWAGPRRRTPGERGALLEAWAAGLDAPVGALDTVVVREPSFVSGVLGLLTADRLDAWRDWLAVRVIRPLSPLPLPRVRRRELRLHRHRADRHARAAGPLEARRLAGRGRDGRGGRPALRRAALPADREGADGRAGREPRRRLPRLDLRPRLDERARPAPARSRSSASSRRRSATRTTGGTTRSSRSSADDLVGNVRGIQRLRVRPRARQDRQAGRPRRVVHDPADDQRLLQPRDQRDRVPGGDPAVPLLRSRPRRRGRTTAASAR